MPNDWMPADIGNVNGNGTRKNQKWSGFGIGNGRDRTGYIKTGKSHQDATVESSRDGKITNPDPPDPYYRAPCQVVSIPEDSGQKSTKIIIKKNLWEWKREWRRRENGTYYLRADLKFYFFVDWKTDEGFRRLLTPIQPLSFTPLAKKFSIYKGPPFGFSTLWKSALR